MFVEDIGTSEWPGNGLMQCKQSVVIIGMKSIKSFGNYIRIHYYYCIATRSSRVSSLSEANRCDGISYSFHY